MKLADLGGYVESAMDADLTRWLFGAKMVAIASSVPPVTTFLATLSPTSASALARLDAKVRSGTLPTIWLLDIMDDWTYGFDFVANAANVIDESGKNIASTLWAVGCDGSGNYYVVRPDGRVATWYPTSGDEIDPHAQFANLDVFMWAKIRRAAVQAKTLSADDSEIAAERVYAWNERKARFSKRQIGLAFDVLARQGWLQHATA